MIPNKQETPIEEESYLDAESMWYTDKDKISFRLIILHHYKNTIASYGTKNLKEMMNHVDGLYDACYPFLDKIAKEEDKKLQERLEFIHKHAEEKSKTCFGLEWSNYVSDCYYPNLKPVYRKLFRMLTNFLKRNDFFKTKDVED